jgi:hypothetical protein
MKTKQEWLEFACIYVVVVVGEKVTMTAPN